MRLPVAGLALVGLAAAASAADVPARVSAPAPAFVPALSWAGFYVGAHGGYGWGDKEARVGSNCCVVFPLDLTNRVFPRSIGARRDGPAGGAQAGYNIQVGRYVAGLEADVSWMASRSKAVHSAPDPMYPGSPITISTFQSKLDWLGTLRGRAGLTFGRALVYGTGGAAYGEVEDKAAAAIPALGYAPPAWTRRSTQWGWTAGGGVEYALNKSFSIKAEYLYYDLGEQTVRASDPATFPPGEHIDYLFSNSGSIARAGVNFRF